VVDLWCGTADHYAGRPWSRDTLTVLFSGTKGLTAVCMLLLLERGTLELDAPLARYWPEFAAAGKEGITVAEVLSHRSRLPAFRAPVGIADLQDPAVLIAKLAAQTPFREPAAAGLYHPLTYGYLCAELVRRADGRSLGRFFAEEVAEPLGLDAWIGLPAEHERRVSVISLREEYGQALAALKAMSGRSEYLRLLELVYCNPPIVEAPDHAFNSREMHAAENPAVGAIATARSMARLYACLANGGEIDGVRLLSRETLHQARRVHSVWHDEVSGVDARFGLGFELGTTAAIAASGKDSFGHGGLGGSLHGAWPAAGVGFSYVTNSFGDRQPDPRAAALLAALGHCLEAPAPSGRLERALGSTRSRAWTSHSRRVSLGARLVRNRSVRQLRRALLGARSMVNARRRRRRGTPST